MEAKALRKEVKTLVRFHLVPSDASKARPRTTVEAREAAASQNVAVREVVAASDSEREERSQSPRQPNLSTRNWRTTG